MTSLYRILADRGVPKLFHHEQSPHSSNWDPVGVMIHHTATKGPALEVCKKGRSDLPGPLCNLNIERNGDINVICDGLAYHAGKGSSFVLNETKRDIAPSGTAKSRQLKDDITGNSYFYGIEVDNDGVGEPYPREQINSVLLCLLALKSYHGWPSVNRNILHKEWTGRKIDWSYQGDIRKELTDLIRYLGG